MPEAPNEKLEGKTIWDRVKELKHHINLFLYSLLPPKEAQISSAWAVGSSIVLAAAILGSDVHSGFGYLVDIFSSAILAGLGFFLFQALLQWVFSIINRSLSRLASIFVAGLVFCLSFSNLKEILVFWPIFFLMVNLMVLSLSLSHIRSNKWKVIGRLSKVLTSLLSIITFLVILFFIFWLIDPGTDEHLVNYEPYQEEPTIEASDPSLPGPFEVLRLSYGSGTDLRREEYADGVDLISNTVNASSFVYNPDPDFQDFKNWFKNFPEDDFPLENWIESKLRFWYWGFDRKNYPLNAQVWYPEGDGEFPLVLMVHGNHEMVERSELGYAYLGELLASRGYIFVSIDENFLNGYFAGGISGENDARGWLLLKHLELWEEWNDDLDNIFFEKVDLNNIALIGHSRGGEAVSVAAAFNRLDKYPDNGNIKLDFNFNIRSIIAIAPVDKQYKPADNPLPLSDVNYLVIQGAHDADVSNFSGLGQYQRVSFSDPSSDFFKSALYIYQANHSQFNSDWGRYDLGLPRSYYLNIKPLLLPEQQRQLASVYISAFLDSTLKSVKEYRSIFEDYHNAGIWLPDTLYTNQFQSASYLPLANFEEDIDLITTSYVGGSIQVSGLTRWKEVGLEFRKGKDQENNVANLAWVSKKAKYEILIP